MATTLVPKPFPICDFCDEHPGSFMRRDFSGEEWHACVKHTAELQTTVDEVNANFTPEELAWFRRPLEGC